MKGFHEWIIEGRTIRVPSDINNLSTKQFLRLIKVYYEYPNNFGFRVWAFFSIAQMSISTKVWMVWSFFIKKWLSKYLPIKYKDFAEGDFEHSIKLLTDFLMENEEEVLLAKQPLKYIKIRRFKFLGKYSPTFKIFGHTDYGESILFKQYREAEKAFFQCNINEKISFENLLRALYKSNKPLKDWQLKAVSHTIKQGVYFWYNDIREFWKRQFDEVFSENTTKSKSKSDDFTPDDLEQNLTTWLHYVAKEDPTKYAKIDDLPAMTVLFNWNEIKIKQRAEAEYLKKQNRA